MNAFRLILQPAGGKPRMVECPKTIRHILGARRWARAWVSDVGPGGTISVQRRATKDGHTAYEHCCTGKVVNSEITGWA